jgi:hypothetical protein
VDHLTDKDHDTEATGDHSAAQGSLTDPNKRRFSRNALTGAAVLLSLANRAAWGGQTQVMGVMSVATLNSFNPATGLFVSAPTGQAGRAVVRPGHNVELAKEIRRISPNPPFTGGTDGTYSTCKDATSFDSVVLVKGKCPLP